MIGQPPNKKVIFLRESITCMLCAHNNLNHTKVSRRGDCLFQVQLNAFASFKCFQLLLKPDARSAYLRSKIRVDPQNWMVPQSNLELIITLISPWLKPVTEIFASIQYERLSKCERNVQLQVVFFWLFWQKPDPSL